MSDGKGDWEGLFRWASIVYNAVVDAEDERH